MPRTRKFGVGRRRKTFVRRRRLMKGGGKLDRLPVGPGSRNEAGNPAEEIFEIAAAAPVAAGGAGAEAAAPAAARMFVGTPEALNYGRKDYKSRINHILGEKPADITDKNLADLIIKTVNKLPQNTRRGYGNLPKFYQGRLDQLAEKFAIVSSFLRNEAPAFPDIYPLREVISGIKDDFRTNWEFKYICGHGVLAPDKPQVVVPPRTYIRFNSPAGCIAVAKSAIKGVLPPMISYPDVFIHAKGSKAEEKEAFIKSFTEQYFENKGPLESFSSLDERLSVQTNPYPSEYCNLKFTKEGKVNLNETLTEESTEAKCLTSAQKKLTIYMPGETMLDMNISFKNNPNEFLILGVYNLPVDYKFYDAVLQNAISTRGGPPLTAAQQLDFDNEHFKNDSFHNIEGEVIINYNLNKPIIGHKVLLSRLLAELDPVPEGKVRFIFINSCRGIPMLKNDDGLRRNIMQAWDASAAAAAAAAAGGGGGGGAGAPAAAAAVPELIPPASRRNLAVLQRSASVGSETSIEKRRQVSELVESMRWLKTHRDDGSAEYKRKKDMVSEAFDRTQRKPFDNTYFLAESLV